MEVKNGVFYQTPAIGKDGTIYVYSTYGSSLEAYNPDGSLKWKVDLSSSQATFSNNNSLTMDQLGNLYLFAQELEDNNSKSYKRYPSSIPRTSPSFYNF